MDLDTVKREISALFDIEGVSREEVASYIVVPQDTTLGDYALPCFRFAKALRKSPVAIAVDFANALNAKEHPFKKIEAVNGYLNFTPVKSFENSIDTPLSVSFSVAKMYGSLAPFQSNEELSILSGKSQFG